MVGFVLFGCFFALFWLLAGLFPRWTPLFGHVGLCTGPRSLSTSQCGNIQDFAQFVARFSYLFEYVLMGSYLLYSTKTFWLKWDFLFVGFSFFLKIFGNSTTWAWLFHGHFTACINLEFTSFFVVVSKSLTVAGVGRA